MRRTTRATIVFLALIIAIVVYRSMTITGYECEVCLTFRGTTVCRTAASGTRETSIESAVTSACGTLASGMTESIRCQNTEPESVTCERR
ncbi:MAG: hypothetical protein ACE5JH_06755 [Acidobacteriota bacterium]